LSKNNTSPLGVPDPGEGTLTVAVKVTLCPKVDGENGARLIPVAAGLTVCVRVGAVLPAKLAVPPKEAEIRWLPTVKLPGEMVAWPLPFRPTGLPKLTPSIWNCTVPLGIPALGEMALTVAVKVAPCPETAGFAEEVRSVLVDAVCTSWFRLSEALA
jgi:hypothetical protein